MDISVAELKTGHHPVVSRERWLAEREKLLAREKELTRLGDQIACERRALPWVRVEKNYRFDTLQGPQTLAGLFQGRRQLLMQHFMLAPGWEQGCKACSFMADHHDGANPHLAQRDVTLMAVARSPLTEIERFRRRMGWKFAWASSHGSDFNRDFGVHFAPEALVAGEVRYNYAMQALDEEDVPGISVFCKDDAGDVFHTYSRYGRGVEVMIGTYALLDLMPKGRNEEALSFPMEWVRHHDRYEQQRASMAAPCCAARA